MTLCYLSPALYAQAIELVHLLIIVNAVLDTQDIAVNWIYAVEWIEHQLIYVQVMGYALIQIIVQTMMDIQENIVTC